MEISALKPQGLIYLQPKRHQDDRGYFSEVYQSRRYQEAGLKEPAWVQDNLVVSQKGALRGLHFQKSQPQAKLIYVAHGEIFDVAVDLRPGSVTYGQYWAGILSRENGAQLYLPQGFAHGYQALSSECVVIYKCSTYYQPHDEGGLYYNDPALNIKWPLKNPLVSPKDEQWPNLAQL